MDYLCMNEFIKVVSPPFPIPGPTGEKGQVALAPKANGVEDSEQDVWTQ